MKRHDGRSRRICWKAGVFGAVLRRRCGLPLNAWFTTPGCGVAGRYSNSPLKPWFDSLKSGKEPCCSAADGLAVSDPDWESNNGHYRVRVDNEWIDVPDDAVITEPNRAGRAMVWLIKGSRGIIIRCFMPGSMT
jgi:hypothetical protein